MSATTRRRGPYPFSELHVLLGLVVVAFLGCGVVWLGAYLATPAGAPKPPASPITMIWHLRNGRYTWPGAKATLYASLLGAAFLSSALMVGVSVLLRKRRRVKIDRAIPYLARPRDLMATTTRGVRETADKIGYGHVDPPGVAVGRLVRGGQMLWGSWEDMHVDIWGPRTGKTSARAIPNIVAAPGAVVVTSNKRDVVDATRNSRARRGRVWVFDPQNQANEPPSWYWDPLEYVNGKITLAVKTASRIASINRAEHVRSDAYFEPAAEELLANLLLAASLDGRVITAVYTWLTRPADDAPVRILRAHGHTLSADSVLAIVSSPERQRAGVYGTAAQMASFLTAPSMTEWVTPGSDPSRPRFRYKEFVRDATDSLYLLSEETNKMAAPLITVFTAALAEEAENQGTAGPGGRLPTPMLFVLDEAANVCPWKALPDKYSHFGSRGIVMMTILQSWAQGVSAWGETGMAKLWGAANVRVYGGGVLDTKFLADLSSASGVFEPHTVGVSYSTSDVWKRNISTGSRSEPVLDVPDLASLPRGRAFVQVSGSPPALVRTVPWWDGDHATEIRASLLEHGPAPRTEAVPGKASAA
ncbi:type IV secretory system conjugative DNA transfer family protein [Streptodolium elevatio]|uniref:TraM recognition domain-containing protein n=1 Tax=Streptodolium elevatio TaxID=3157996 RepID=A0ABV3DDY0_9ACTN